mgnify:CR=1 FL=1
MSEEPVLVSKFRAFLDREDQKKQIFAIADGRTSRFILDLGKLASFDYTLADSFLAQPDTHLEAFREALHDALAVVCFETVPKINIGVVNLPGTHKLDLANLKSSYLNKLVEIRGLVRAKTVVLNLLETAVFKCQYCGGVYRILQSWDSLTKPPSCECGHKDFKLLEERCTWRDFQRIEVQETLENVKSTDQASYIECVLTDDLVNSVTPGDIARFVGILRLKPNKSNIRSSILEVLSVEVEQKSLADICLSSEEIEEFKEFVRRPNYLSILVNSIAPTIYGCEAIKKAILLQQVGGVTKHVLGSRFRGEIHVLLVGDPSTAKSKLLTFACNLNPRGVHASGKGASGVGLTASIEKGWNDSWVLKAGALVLANQGLLGLDEFDKLNEEHKAHLHEAMAEGRLSINKAGINGVFKAETSVLAAANPKYGRFDPFIPLSQQFDIAPTLLSRFDLIFAIRDVVCLLYTSPSPRDS